MYSDIVYRAGDEKTLLSEFLRQADTNSLNFEVSIFEPHKLAEENVLAVQENFELPENWRYLYMGAMNHLLLRKELFSKAQAFIDAYLQNGGYSWRIFSAVAWLCQAKQIN